VTALIIGLVFLSLGLGALIGVTVGTNHEEKVGYSSLALIAVGLLIFGLGLGLVLA
jgi:hypothetical protein